MNTSYEIEFLEDATEKLKAIAHPIRFLMIEMLYNAKEMSVTDVHEKLDIEQAVASHHLRILKNQNIVKVNRDGKNSFYSLSSDVYFNIILSNVCVGLKSDSKLYLHTLLYLYNLLCVNLLF